MTVADNEKQTAVVVSAHSADFVWRAGGAIALYAERGWDITIVCLSFGERGESAKLWREAGMTMERVKAVRKEEAVGAAEVLGAKTIFFDVGDYPMRMADETLYKLAKIYRDLRPQFILTHALNDPYNFDHPHASHVAQEARIVAQAHGHDPATKVLARRPCSSSSRISPNNVSGNRRFCWISHRSGRRSTRHSRSWRRRSTSGSTTSGLRCSEASRAPAIRIGM